LDETSLRRLVRHYASLPVDGFILAATSGEGMSLSMSELERLVTITRAEISASRRYIPILLGLSGASTHKMCDALDETAAWPIDGYLIASPYYIRPSQRGLLQHFTTLADHASWPLVLYNIPYRTAVGIDNDTLLQLAAHPNIVGMKESGNDLLYITECVNRTPDDFTVLAGSATTLFQSLCAGVDGAVLALAALLPDECVQIVKLVKENRIAEARELQRKVTPLARSIGGGYGITGLKAALDLLGFNGGLPRPPLRPASKPIVETIRGQLDALGVLPVRV
jgi:4-hydroxy-tetrahydrodipicolinate synthase